MLRYDEGTTFEPREARDVSVDVAVMLLAEYHSISRADGLPPSSDITQRRVLVHRGPSSLQPHEKPYSVHHGRCEVANE